MDIRELKYFVEIAKECNLTKAATNLYVSQPALSKTIKKLEQELDITLFEKCGSKMILTDCGETLFHHAQSLLLTFDDMVQSVVDTKNLKKGHVTLGTTSLIDFLYFSQIHLEFKKKYPGVDIYTVEEGTEAISAGLIRGEIDMGLVIQPVESEHLTEIPISHHDEIVAVIPQENPLAAQESLSFADLKNQPIHIFSSNYIVHDLIVARCKEAGFEPLISCTSGQWDFLLKMAHARREITLLPRPVVPLEAYPDMCIRPFRPRFPWVICLVLRQNKYISPAMAALIQEIQEYFPQLGSSRLKGE